MSLFCMSPVCLWRQREFADFLECGEPPAEAPLTKHLARCQACRVAWAEMRGLSSALTEAVTAPLASDTLVQAMWKRIDDGERRKPISVRNWNYALPIIIAALFLLGVSATLRSAREIHPAVQASLALSGAATTTVADHVKENTPKTAILGPKAGVLLYMKPASSQVASLDIRQTGAVPEEAQRHQQKAQRSQSYQEAFNEIRHARSQFAFGMATRERRETAALSARLTASEPVLHAVRSRGFVPVGSSLDQQRQAFITQAAVSHDQQSAGSRDPNITFIAGQSAENAGDTEQAVTDYVSALHEDAKARSGQNGSAPG